MNLVPFFVAGLAASVHCAGMCGGIVSAISLAPARPFPVAVVTHTASAATRSLAYNAGRIGSYAVAGAIAGGAAGGARMLSGLVPWQTGALWAANLMLLAVGLYLAGALPLLAHLERIGQRAWRALQPATRGLLPATTPGRLLALGALWGWLPCGMVYSMLLTAMLSGSAPMGAAVMLAFGLGTLPLMAALGAAGGQFRHVMQRRPWRVGAGLLVAAFGALGLWRAWRGVPGWMDVLCIAGAPA